MSNIVRTDSGAAMPPSVILKSAVSVGAMTGCSGLVFGSAVGILRSAHPTLFALTTGLQWFGLGTTFCASRNIILNMDIDRLKNTTYASTIAGSLAGATIGAIARGRTNIIPGAAMFGLFGFIGQRGYNSLDASHTACMGQSLPAEPVRPLINRIAGSSWSPMKFLSDDDYAILLRERLLKIEAEIALIDNDIWQLKGKGKKCVQNSESPDYLY